MVFPVVIFFQCPSAVILVGLSLGVIYVFIRTEIVNVYDSEGGWERDRRDGERRREMEGERGLLVLIMCFLFFGFVCFLFFLSVCFVFLFGCLFSCRFPAPAVTSLCLLSGFLCLVLCVILCVVAGCLFHSICPGNRFSLSNSRFQTAVVYE